MYGLRELEANRTKSREGESFFGRAYYILPINMLTALNREDGTRIVSFQDRSHVMAMERHDVTFL